MQDDQSEQELVIHCAYSNTLTYSYLWVYLPEVVHDTVQVELSRTKHHMLPRLLHLQEIFAHMGMNK